VQREKKGCLPGGFNLALYNSEFPFYNKR